MKSFVTSLFLVIFASAASAQMNKKYVASDGSVIMLETKSEDLLFETQHQWIMVGCSDSRDLQASQDGAEHEALMNGLPILVLLAKEPSLVDKVPGTIAWRIKDPLRRVRMGYDAGITPVSSYITAHGDIYSTCMAVALSKSVATLDDVRQYAKLEVVR